MTVTVEAIKSQLLAFPLRDRAELAQFLIRTLQDSDDCDAEPVLDAELSRRVDDIESGAEPGEPADAIFECLRAKYTSR
jgi:hypothetical protein